MALKDSPAIAGQAIYTPLTLRAYDCVVLGISNRYLWRCPTASLRALYRRNVGRSHLDIGVGTGYFLDRLPRRNAGLQIILLDLNRHSLRAAARRIARHNPQTVTANCLQPFGLDGKVNSIGFAICCIVCPAAWRRRRSSSTMPQR